jgi:ribose transport system permease protein
VSASQEIPASAAASPGGSRATAVSAAARRWAPQATTWGPPIVLLLLIVGFAIVSDGFLTSGNLTTVLNQSAVPMVVAIGLTFVIVQGSIDLSVEGNMGLCGLLVALLVANSANGNDLGWLGVLAALAVGAAFGLLNGLLFSRLRLPSLMVTLGTWSVGLGCATLLFPGSQPKVADSGLTGIAGNTFLGPNLTFWVAAGVLALAFLVQRYTRFGRLNYAIGGGEEIARLSGINVNRFKTLAFVAAGLLFSVAAILTVSRSGYGNVSIGQGSLFSGVAAVVIGGTLLSGGVGGVLQSAVGVLILTVLANGMVLAGIDPFVQEIVQGAIIIIAVTVSTWPLRARMRVIK